MSIETRFDIPLIAAMALKEKQIQQNYRPIIAVHKWFARRPGTLFRGLILSEFADRPLSESYFCANDFPGRVIADPFMGGGIPLIEANRVGCDVMGFDVNPMAAWIVREEIDHLDLRSYRNAAADLVASLDKEVGNLYRTDCPIYGDKDVPVKYFLWVKVLDCEKCGHEIDLFPGYLLARNTRHPKHVLVCSGCGALNEVTDRHRLGKCRDCHANLVLDGPARRNQCACPACRHVNRFPRPINGPLRHRMFAIEYHNHRRRSAHVGRFFKKPDAQDLDRATRAALRWKEIQSRFVPNDVIPSGDETDRLHRWGYSRYRELFNDRQLLGLELSCQLISSVTDQRVRHALATNLSDLLRYQNMLCRYDTMALKSLDIFSIHGFPVGLVQCESNLLGIFRDDGSNVGSGGWTNIIEKYSKAKRYCEQPFETREHGGRKIVVPITGEWIGERSNGSRARKVSIKCTSSTMLALEPASLDAVLTDPPYFGNVQYSELMDFCYVWLRSLVGTQPDGFDRASTRSPNEVGGNHTQARRLVQFTDGLSAVYRAVVPALKTGAPLVFTFHHNRLEAYHAVGVAILDSGLTCSASLPCPGEMGGSIHIHGTGSSIIDTVFVCRVHGTTRRQLLCDTPEKIVRLVADEVGQLRSAGVRITAGDMRCIVFGHLTRLAVWKLRKNWDTSVPTLDRLGKFAKTVSAIGDIESILDELAATVRRGTLQVSAAPPASFEGGTDAVPV